MAATDGILRQVNPGYIRVASTMQAAHKRPGRAANLEYGGGRRNLERVK
jgi:hypothetical protein